MVVIEAPAPRSNFTIAGRELDTWNAVGQILVNLDGVTYQGRAQKLGLYDMDYRGERFLILTRALVLSSEIQATTTEVRTVLQNGKPDSSAPAIGLLGLLQAWLPAELLRIASEKNDAQVKKKAGCWRSRGFDQTARSALTRRQVLQFSMSCVPAQSSSWSAQNEISGQSDAQINNARTPAASSRIRNACCKH